MILGICWIGGKVSVLLTSVCGPEIFICLKLGLLALNRSVDFFFRTLNLSFRLAELISLTTGNGLKLFWGGIELVEALKGRPLFRLKSCNFCGLENVVDACIGLKAEVGSNLSY